MTVWLRPRAWRALFVSTALLVCAPAARALPSSSLALPLPAADLSQRLAEETVAPASESESKKPSNLGEVGRSLVLPGWGALHAGHRNVGLAFLVVEASLWTTVAVSSGQGGMRTHSFEQTAQIYAGIDLTQHDENYRKLVSSYQSSDEYNRLVVYRNAAALYYGDFASYTAYINTHSLTGANSWNWEDLDQWAHYQDLRRSSERAYQRARFAAAGLIVNRIVAAIVSSRMAPASSKVAARAATSGEGFAFGPVEWTIASSPEHPLDLHHRLAWVIPLE